MTSGGAGSDHTGWPGLLTSARQGKLQLLNVDSGSLRALTLQCEDLVAIILGLINVIDTMDWTQYTSADGYWKYNWQRGKQNVTTSLSSMRTLFLEIKNSSKFGLVGALQDHQAVITDMANTFIAADKQYSTAEGENAITFTTPAAKDVKSTGPMSVTRSISGGEWMNGSFSNSGGSGVGYDSRAKDAIGPTIESGSFFGLLDFANIAEMFDRADGHIWEMAGAWHQIGQTWSEAVETFRTNNHAVFKNQNWQGAGAESAVKALNDYITSATGLQQAIQAVSTVLADTGDFNLYCWGHLPRHSQMHYNSDGTVHDVNNFAADKDLAAARTWWDGHESGGAKGYVDGIAILAGMIPAFIDPGAKGGSGGSGNSGGGTGGNGASGNSGGTGGSGDGGGTGGSGDGGGGTGGSGTGGSGDHSGGGSQGGGGPKAGKPHSPGGSPFSSSPTGPVASGPTGPADSLTGASGPLSTLANMLQQLSSGAPTGPLGVSGPWNPSGPWMATGPWGASGPFGFDVNPAGLGGGAGGGGSPGANPLDDKLFPRAPAPAPTTAPGAPTVAADGRAGPAVTSGMPMGGMMGGMPMGGGMGGAQAGQQKERKRAAYLDGKEHLDEAVGEDPLSVRPIIDR
ncbi:hypothetical protein OHB26_21415 [Nocardia sp. NBC_01503]|uniref:hypothetical protein n=1 Tax=Nocardia sp. NBC_01503 TaxID=2975997 RepID=UPI002E7BE70A|nr:hypothetical protein [Nocardia sp. NBC_01503]WTL29545.1 hypothetical protein OHB26_21415 [Nocardia sp. NBC_01503]